MGKLLIALLFAAATAGCSTSPPAACDLIAIATAEAQLAEAWYIEAGAVLTQCGNPTAAALAIEQACAARRFNDSSVECKP